MENDTFSETAGLSRRANFRVLSEAVGGAANIPSRGAAGVAWEEGAARMASDDEDHERMQALCDEFEELCRQLRYHQKACVPRDGMTTSALVLSVVRPTRPLRHPDPRRDHVLIASVPSPLCPFVRAGGACATPRTRTRARLPYRWRRRWRPSRWTFAR